MNPVARKRRVAMVIGSPIHLDQMLFHGALVELAEKLDLVLVAPAGADLSEVVDEMSRSGCRLEVVRSAADPRSSAAADRLTRAMTFRFRPNSSGYRARFANAILGSLGVPLRPWWRRTLALTLHGRTVATRTVRELPTIFRGSRVGFRLYRTLAYRRVTTSQSVMIALSPLAVDACLVVMQRQQAFVIQSLRWSASRDVPSLLLPVKWDNATSKSPLIDLPTRLGVYSDQSGRECIRLHGLASGALATIGNAEYSAAPPMRSTSDSLRVLAAGNVADCRVSAPWLTALVSVVRTRERGDGAPVTVTWRPYPTRQAEYLEFMRDFVRLHPQITLDVDIASERSHRHAGANLAQRRAAYWAYRTSLADSTLVVSETTSLILDARAVGVPVIVPAFRDGATYGSQWHLLNGFEHLRGLRTTNGVFIAETEEEFVRLVNDFLDHPRRIPPDNSGEHIFVDERTYAQRLIDVIEDAIAEKERERATARASRRDSSVQTSGHG